MRTFEVGEQNQCQLYRQNETRQRTALIKYHVCIKATLPSGPDSIDILYGEVSNIKRRNFVFASMRRENSSSRNVRRKGGGSQIGAVHVLWGDFKADLDVGMSLIGRKKAAGRTFSPLRAIF